MLSNPKYFPTQSMPQWLNQYDYNEPHSDSDKRLVIHWKVGQEVAQQTMNLANEKARQVAVMKLHLKTKLTKLSIDLTDPLAKESLKSIMVDLDAI